MITTLWIVTRPTRLSTLADICFETTLPDGLYNQFMGGLHPFNIVGCYISAEDAKREAERLLAVRNLP